MEIPEAMSTALGFHQAGRMPEAEQIYRQILAADPNHPGAWHFLGVLAFQFAKHDVAIQLIERALALKPDYVEAYHNLGAVFDAQGKLDEAVACYRRVLALQPSRAAAHFQLGLVLSKLCKRDEAIDCYRQAIQLQPDFAEAHGNLGYALLSQGKLEQASACYRRIVDLKPNDVEGYNNLGSAYYALGKLDDAIASFRQALQLNPNIAEVLNGLATVHQMRGESDEAIACYRRALELKPDYIVAHNNLGNALKDRADLEESLACYRRALQLNPNDSDVHSNLLYALYFCPGLDSQAIGEEHRRWNQQHAAPLARFIQPHGNDPTPSRRLRVGYVSPYFRHHVQSFFTVPLLTNHDHQNFEIFCYADVATPDALTERSRSYADVWRDYTGLSDEQVAQRIRQDQIDILVDLTMHMAQSRPLIFACKPAPVQVCWLAYPGTTGLATMDYRLTDPYLDPPGHNDNVYSEHSVRLPDSFWCYDPLATEPAVNPLPAVTSGQITFGSLNNFCKVNAAVLRLWAGVLRAVDRSRLVILVPEGALRQRTLGILEQESIAAGRVSFVGKQPLQQFRELYHQIDIGLDTIPYNGHTTSLDAYWMGVPVVTLVGQTVVGRAGLCQLTNLGLPELIAQTPDDFVRIAADLAGDLPRLSQLRESLRQRLQRSPLMDAPRFARNVEAVYRELWRRWCADKSP